MKPSEEIIREPEKGGAERGPRRRYMLLSILSVLLGVVAWQVTARFTNKLFFVGPWDTGAAFVELLRSGDLQGDLWISGLELSYGFALSILIGVPLGLAIAISRRAAVVVDPWAPILYATA